jgi:hypothetical protein
VNYSVDALACCEDGTHHTTRAGLRGGGDAHHATTLNALVWKYCTHNTTRVVEHEFTRSVELFNQIIRVPGCITSIATKQNKQMLIFWIRRMHGRTHTRSGAYMVGHTVYNGRFGSRLKTSELIILVIKSSIYGRTQGEAQGRTHNHEQIVVRVGCIGADTLATYT